MTFSMAPGLRLAPGQLNQVCQHAVLGHGMAVQAVRAKARGVEVC
jgi:beta-glucosidase